MPDDARIQELFHHWQDERRLGHTLSVEELCRDCPELTEELEYLINDHLAATPPTVIETNNNRPPLPPATIIETANRSTSPPAAAAESVQYLNLAPGVEPVAGYRLVHLLGRGSFGQVWKAIGPGGFAVALKCVPLGGTADAAELRALEVMKDIRHANLLALFGAWQTADCLYMAMELADDSLLDRCNECRHEGCVGIPREELIEYMRDAAKGIDFLNEPHHVLQGQAAVGIQHRDIKPQNLLRVGGSVKVADFGLAKILQHSGGSNSGSMTAAYAAPECFKGQTSQRSDQYSLAVTYCQLRGGVLPFAGNSVAEIMLGHVHRPPDLSMLPPEEQPAVTRALAKEPEQRWPSCRAFIAGLSESVPGSAEFQMSEALELLPEPEELDPSELEDSLPTLLPSSPLTRTWPDPAPLPPRRRSSRWLWALLLAALAATAGGITIGVLYTLTPGPDERAANTRPEETRPAPTRPTPPVEPTEPVKPPPVTTKATEPVKPPPPDPEKERREKAAAAARRGQELLDRKEPALAIPFFTEAIRLDPKNAAFHLQRGKANYEIKEYAKAIDDTNESIKLDDTNGAAYALRGRSQAELKHHHLAIEDFDRAIAHGTRDASVYTSRGTAYANRKQYGKALDDFDEALRQSPKVVLTLFNRGVVYEKLEKYEDAVTDFSAALKLDDKYFRAYASRGRAYTMLGRREDALSDYDTALKLDPNNVWAWNARGQLYSLYFEDFGLAVSDYSKAISLDPQYVVAYFNRAIAYTQQEEYAKAIEDCTKALAIDPKNAPVLVSRGWAQFKLKRYKNAAADYDKAMDADPDYARTYNARGVLFAEGYGDYEKAIQEYTRAIKLDPKYLRAYEYRALAYDKIKDRKRADADRKKASELEKELSKKKPRDPAP